MFIASASHLRGADAQNNFHIRFGIIARDDLGNYFISKETTNIPRKFRETGFRFGYEVVPPDQNPYTCQFVVHLPSPPDAITGGIAQVNPGKPSTTITSQKKEISGRSYIALMWFDPGDPVGDYSVDVFVNGKLLKTIKFNVRNA
jgi:hypothetical protein